MFYGASTAKVIRVGMRQKNTMCGQFKVIRDLRNGLINPGPRNIAAFFLDDKLRHKRSEYDMALVPKSCFCSVDGPRVLRLRIEAVFTRELLNVLVIIQLLCGRG